MRIKESELRKEISLRLYKVFEIYFHGALTIGFFHSKFKKEMKEDYIENIHKKLLLWRDHLKKI